MNTLFVYESCLNKIFDRFIEPQKAALIEIREFAASYTNDNTRKNICVILRWLFNDVYHAPIDWRDLPYPKRKLKVQEIYTQDEVFKILGVIKNEKHKAIFAIIIDCGLRVSEPCSILLSDCNSKERSIVIRNTKGGNDRVIYPSDYVWGIIKKYWSAWRGQEPKKYLFEGANSGLPYTPESIRAFLKTYCKSAGVKYKAVHSFRRFSITWSIESGAPLSAVANKVGHKSVKTIEKHYIIHSPNYLRGLASPLAL